jgi:hypothetical protein
VRQKFLDFRTKKALINSRAVRATIPYSASREIGILFTVENNAKHEMVKSFINKLQNDGKKVQVLEFLPKKKDNPEFRFDFFTIEDLGFWGTIHSETADRFSRSNFDYLFIIDVHTNPLIMHVLANSMAHCRIGKYDVTSKAYLDFMIETNGSLQSLIDNMYSYTRQLR